MLWGSPNQPVQGSEAWTRASQEVASALEAGRPIVALESSVWVQGLKWPSNWETAQQVEAAVRAEGAVPAVIWVEDGRIHYGLSEGVLEDLCRHPRGSKLNVADLPAALATRAAGATTVSASLRAAELMGIKVFATGGIGGIHRGWQDHLDVSADLAELARSPVLTVCAGAKCVLDLTATLEALESLAIPIYRYACDGFPEFFCRGKNSLGTRFNIPAELARAADLSKPMLGRAGLVVQDPPDPLDPEQVRMWLQQGLDQAPRGGKEVTPFLLTWMAQISDGQTVAVNRRLLVANARLAAQIACQPA